MTPSIKINLKEMSHNSFFPIHLAENPRGIQVDSSKVFFITLPVFHFVFAIFIFLQICRQKLRDGFMHVQLSNAVAWFQTREMEKLDVPFATSNVDIFCAKFHLNIIFSEISLLCARFQSYIAL